MRQDERTLASVHDVRHAALFCAALIAAGEKRLVLLLKGYRYASVWTQTKDAARTEGEILACVRRRLRVAAISGPRVSREEIERGELEP